MDYEEFKEFVLNSGYSCYQIAEYSGLDRMCVYRYAKGQLKKRPKPYRMEPIIEAIKIMNEKGVEKCKNKNIWKRRGNLVHGKRCKK